MLHTAQYSTMIHLFYFISKSFEMGIAICLDKWSFIQPDMTLSLTLDVWTRYNETNNVLFCIVEHFGYE